MFNFLKKSNVARVKIIHTEYRVYFHQYTYTVQAENGRLYHKTYNYRIFPPGEIDVIIDLKYWSKL